MPQYPEFPTPASLAAEAAVIVSFMLRASAALGPDSSASRLACASPFVTSVQCSKRGQRLLNVRLFTISAYRPPSYE